MLSMAERTEQFVKLTQQMITLQSKKGLDYGEDSDGLKNLRRRGVQGVVARMGDKLSRLESLTQPGRVISVLDESIDDTLIDLANYSLLLIILRADLAKTKECPHLRREDTTAKVLSSGSIATSLDHIQKCL